MADALRRLAAVLATEGVRGEESQDDTKETIDVSVPTSTAAALYERVRNSLEYQEEHLLRRNAILRMLRRLMNEDGTAESRATQLLQEMVWAKYLPNNTVPLERAHEIAPRFEKYQQVLTAVRALPEGKDAAYGFVLQIMATELEHVFADHTANEALAAFMYEETRGRTEWDPAFELSEEERDIRLFIAVYRTLLKADDATLRWRIFMLYYPAWATLDPHDPLVASVAKSIAVIVRSANERLDDPLTDRLARLARRMAGVYRVVGDIVAQGKLPPVGVERGKVVAKATEERMMQFKKRLSRSVTRSIIFLLITKSFTALLLEVPYDLFTIGHLPALPLAINILFHPLFLAMIALSIRLPAKENVTDYQEAIAALSGGEDHPILHLRVKKTVRTTLSIFFNVVYTLLFVAVYVAIALFLQKIGFLAMSTGLFLFFFSLMGFFGIRLRMSTRDIVASEARTGWLGTVIDILMLPIVRAGGWLAERVSKLNVFVYFFDFIIEAPLKVAIQVVEGWLRFVREKKEEI